MGNNNRPITPRKVANVVNQALDYVQSNPCCICSCEEFCGVKYKGTCKIRRRLRIALLGAKKMEERE